MHKGLELYRAHTPARALHLHLHGHEQKSHGPNWVESIGVANKNSAFAMVVGLAKRFEAY
jgi:hypothetical protein